MSTGKVYLLHFSAPYKHARHYIGFSTDIVQRLQAHDSGRGARLMEVILDAGLTYKLAALIPGTRALERKLKARKNAPKICPICTGKKLNLKKKRG